MLSVDWRLAGVPPLCVLETRKPHELSVTGERRYSMFYSLHKSVLFVPIQDRHWGGSLTV